MSVYETNQIESDGCEVTTTNDPWEGPFPEYNKYGGLTGCSYVRCRDCGRETLTGRKDITSHRDGCRFGGN
jgi:hypothetical protein